MTRRAAGPRRADRGLHEATAAKWMHQGGGNWSRYAAQLARGHPRQPRRIPRRTQCPVRGIQHGQWPDAETWEDGPDALRFPGPYDPVEPAEEDDHPEPLNLDSSRARPDQLNPLP
jgi:hypothetical protein